MDRWPSFVQMNVYGENFLWSPAVISGTLPRPDADVVIIPVIGFDDYFYGDADGDGVMDRLPPNSLST